MSHGNPTKYLDFKNQGETWRLTEKETKGEPKSSPMKTDRDASVFSPQRSETPAPPKPTPEGAQHRDSQRLAVHSVSSSRSSQSPLPRCCTCRLLLAKTSSATCHSSRASSANQELYLSFAKIKDWLKIQMYSFIVIIPAGQHSFNMRLLLQKRERPY